MLVIDPTNDPGAEYAPMSEMDGMFGRGAGAHFHSQNNKNLVPRDVIVEEENERTQDSALLRITEEREETKQAQSQKDLNSDASPPKTSFKVNEDDEQNDENYEDDYEDEPVPTKPFNNKQAEEVASNQEDILKMINNPVERPTTRNPRMQRNETRSKKHESKGDESGEFDQKPQNASALMAQKEIGGHSNFELPDDDDEDE